MKRPVAGRPRAAAAPYHHGDLRNAIIATALTALEEQGAEALTLREVARRAGVSHAAPYRHFADKSALLFAVAEHGFQLLLQRLREAANVHSNPRARVQAALASYVRFGRDAPQQVALMFGAGISLDADPRVKQVAGAAFSGLAGLVRAALPPPLRTEAESVALGLWAQAHGLMLLSAKLNLGDLLGGGDTLDVCLAALERQTDAALSRRRSLRAGVVREE